MTRPKFFGGRPGPHRALQDWDGPEEDEVIDWDAAFPSPPFKTVEAVRISVRDAGRLSPLPLNDERYE
jgi:hypothetical protein